MVDMYHLNYLSQVALQDVNELKRKEATYRGSWKAAGGRSAWFMTRRKIDRMLEMMKPPPTPENFNMVNVDDTIAALSHGARVPGSPEATAEMFKYLRDCYVSENIFAQIRQDPSGADGSVLAEVRDLRRYLLLIEAEMVSRRVVPGVEVTSVGRTVREILAETDPPASPAEGSHYKHDGDLGRRLEDGLPKQADATQYHMSITDPLTLQTWWIVDRKLCDPSRWEHLPRLRPQLNNYEHEGLLPEYRGLYVKVDDGHWYLRPEYTKHWGPREEDAEAA